MKLNQIFTVDLSGQVMKSYYIKSGAFKDVNINLYKSNGEFSQKLSKTLINGDNFIQFDELPLQPSKYVVVITENDPNAKKSSNAKITVMYW